MLLLIGLVLFVSLIGGIWFAINHQSYMMGLSLMVIGWFLTWRFYKQMSGYFTQMNNAVALKDANSRLKNHAHEQQAQPSFNHRRPLHNVRRCD
ncbi:MAG: hypothetical protein AAF403_07355, partial [Pseudomonadota bacterium]